MMQMPRNMAEIVLAEFRLLIVFGRPEKADVFSKMKDPVGIFDRAFDIMRDHNDRDPVLVQLSDQRIHIRCYLRVETRNRLIEKQNIFCRADCSRKKDPLLLPAGQIHIRRFFEAGTAGYL